MPLPDAGPSLGDEITQPCLQRAEGHAPRRLLTRDRPRPLEANAAPSVVVGDFLRRRRIGDHPIPCWASCSAGPMPECIRMVGLLDGAGRQHNLTSNDRLKTFAAQLNADCPCIFGERSELTVFSVRSGDAGRRRGGRK